MDELTKAELARIRDEDQRQNRRIELLEDMSKVIQDLVLSIHGLAKDMEQMLQEQKEQGKRLDNQSKRLDALEREPGNTYKDIKKNSNHSDSKRACRITGNRAYFNFVAGNPLRGGEDICLRTVYLGLMWTPVSGSTQQAGEPSRPWRRHLSPPSDRQQSWARSTGLW